MLLRSVSKWLTFSILIGINIVVVNCFTARTLFAQGINGANVVPANRTQGAQANPNLAAPNVAAPSTTAPSRVAPNRITPSNVPANKNATPDSNFGGLPIRSGAAVNTGAVVKTAATQDTQGNARLGNAGNQGGLGSVNTVANRNAAADQAASQNVRTAMSNNPVAGILDDGAPAPNKSRNQEPGEFDQLGRPQQAESNDPRVVALNKFLNDWEAKNSEIKQFETQFRRFEYGNSLVEGNAGKPDVCTNGQICYAAPNFGMYEVFGEIGEPGKNREKIQSVGKSIYHYDFEKKVLTEYKVPPEQQASIVKGGPVPFIFGAKASDLKKRYVMQIVTPKEKIGKEVWLEVVPRWQEDASEYKSVQMIFDAARLVPKGAVIYGVGGQGKVSYNFDMKSIKVNAYKDDKFLKHYFDPKLPEPDWKYEVADLPAQENQPPAIAPPVEPFEQPLYVPEKAQEKKNRPTF
ncbi:MAG: hypothetical protein ACRC2T_03855 [Thermoguttaceae bacterium]